MERTLDGSEGVAQDDDVVEGNGHSAARERMACIRVRGL
jgi:hypothetical protein